MPPSLRTHLESFLAALEIERGLSPNTVVAYRADCEQFLEGLPRSALQSPESVTEREIFKFLVGERERGRDVLSVCRSLSALRSFFRYLMGMDLVVEDPTRYVESPRTGLRLPSVLHVEDVERLLAAIKENPSRYPLRDIAIVELLYAAGLRVTEAITLRSEDLRPDLGILRCIGKGRRERIVPVSQRAFAAVDRYVSEERPRIARGETDLLFVSRRGKPLGREVVRNMIRKYAMLAGIPGKVTPHTLRHTLATHLLRGGADLRVVQEILGHVKVETTEIYTHLDRSDLKKAHRKFHPRG